MPRLLPGTSPETDLYALTDDELSLGRPAVEVAKALLDSGIKILQYREKEKKAGQMLKECLELRRLTREAGACFIVNDHVDIAVLCEAITATIPCTGRLHTARSSAAGAMPFAASSVPASPVPSTSSGTSIVRAVSSSASTGSSPGNSPSRPCAVSLART